MGVPWDHCEDVATLIGLKTTVNEFVAYKELGKYKKEGRIFGRIEAIATFAICGFANPGSVGITISILSSLAPDKKEIISNIVMRAFISGCVITFLTASVAGKIWKKEERFHFCIKNRFTNRVIMFFRNAGTWWLRTYKCICIK